MHYIRKTKNGTYVIQIPQYDDISGSLLKSIIKQSGVSKKIFWDAYYGYIPDYIKQEAFDLNN